MKDSEQLLKTWSREYPITVKVLKAFPEDKLDFKPHDRSRSAKELAWTLALEEKMTLDGIKTGKLEFHNALKSPDTMAGILEEFEKTHKELEQAIKNISPEREQEKIQFGPMQMTPLEIGWMLLMDSIHHRGQFSVYLRMAGGKVPSIYGPSADETMGM